MKKLIVFGIFVTAIALFTPPIFAKAKTDTCTYIQDGTLTYNTSHFLGDEPLTLGYDIFGYNYQAHIFNGYFANAYLGRYGYAPYSGDYEAYLNYLNNEGKLTPASWYWQFKDVNLMMKWNDAWLANSDCEPIPLDGVLDRHAGFPTYIGSGAWLTNHVKGTYTSSINFQWIVNTSPNKLDIPWAGTIYSYVVTFGQSDTYLTGTLTDPYVQPNPLTGPILNGVFDGENITFDWDYGVGSFQGLRSYVGVIDADGKASGTWTETGGTGSNHSGDWSITNFATKLYDTCSVSDFVKIIAAPSDATLTDGIWYAADSSEIGPVIWGEFAIIQEKSSDPCEEYLVTNYMSPLRKGLGNW